MSVRNAWYSVPSETVSGVSSDRSAIALTGKEVLVQRGSSALTMTECTAGRAFHCCSNSITPF
jgi:hypothetical protein